MPDHGVVAGVAAGLGHRLGLPLAAVRLAFFVTSFAGGAGALAYVALSLTGRPVDPPGPPPSGVVAQRKAVAVVPMLLGVLLGLRELGLWFGDGLVWPVTLAGVGALVIGSRGDEERPDPGAASNALGPLSRVLTAEGDSRRRTVARVVAGALLVAVGMTLFLASTDTLSALAAVAPAVAVLLFGAALIGGPLVYRLVQQLADERRDRIRTQERADLAAHLHDSVLQTLALIQRSGDPREMATLARGQERELRTWLYGETTAEDESRLRDAVQALAGRAEQRWRIAVDPVVVGDAEVDEPLRALLEATTEAVTNAGKHSGSDRVSIYVEIEPDAVTAFVRDEGHGFEPDEVGDDRRGIADSICARLARHRGRAELTTAPGTGTEWLLQVPRTT